MQAASPRPICLIRSTNTEIASRSARRDDVAATGCCRDIILPEHRDRSAGPRLPQVAAENHLGNVAEVALPATGAFRMGAAGTPGAWRRSMAGPIVIRRRYGSHRRHPALAGRARPAPE
jgi:hypothetical protein